MKRGSDCGSQPSILGGPCVRGKLGPCTRGSRGHGTGPCARGSHGHGTCLCARGAPAPTPCVARGHRVSRARVHEVCWERMNSSGSEGICQDKDNFEDLDGGEEGRWVDPLAKLQIRGSKQPNLTRSNKLQEKKFGLFLWGFSNLGEEQQYQASKWGMGLQDVNQPCS